MIKFKLLIFDADNTLFDYDYAENYALRMSLAAFDVPWQADYLEHYRKINSQAWQDYERGKLSRDNLRTERFRNFVNRINVSVNPDELSNRYLAELGNAGFLLAGASRLLEEVHTHCAMALLTNGFSSVQRGRIAKSGIESFFESIVISEEVGSQKPERTIFDLVLSRFDGIDRSSVLMIGDNLVSDIQGGNGAGLQTCWYNPDKLKENPAIAPTYTVSSYDELRDVVFEETD